MEEGEVEVPVTKEPAEEATNMDTDEAPSDAAPPSSSEADFNMWDAKGIADASGVENGVSESRDKPTQKTKVSSLNMYNWILCEIYHGSSIM